MKRKTVLKYRGFRAPLYIMYARAAKLWLVALRLVPDAKPTERNMDELFLLDYEAVLHTSVTLSCLFILIAVELLL